MSLIQQIRVDNDVGRVRCQQRLGGLLRHDSRDAAEAAGPAFEFNGAEILRQNRTLGQRVGLEAGASGAVGAVSNAARHSAACSSWPIPGSAACQAS